MNILITNPIDRPICFNTENKQLKIQHPNPKNIPEIISFLVKEDLDVRRLKSVSHEHYHSMGGKWIRDKWNKILKELYIQESLEEKAYKQLVNQSEDIQFFKPYPPKYTDIKDPFNMITVEKNTSFQNLVKEQIKNIIIAKFNNKLVGMGRLLEVEGSVEIVSLLTRKEFRRKGIASMIIDQLLERSSIRPIFSFQKPALIPFYFRKYHKHGNVNIASFSKLPTPLQRDLFYMNSFWGPYTIMCVE